MSVLRSAPEWWEQDLAPWPGPEYHDADFPVFTFSAYIKPIHPFGSAWQRVEHTFRAMHEGDLQAMFREWLDGAIAGIGGEAYADKMCAELEAHPLDVRPEKKRKKQSPPKHVGPRPKQPFARRGAG